LKCSSEGIKKAFLLFRTSSAVEIVS
jgi:hypothetical protein